MCIKCECKGKSELLGMGQPVRFTLNVMYYIGFFISCYYSSQKRILLVETYLAYFVSRSGVLLKG